MTQPTPPHSSSKWRTSCRFGGIRAAACAPLDFNPQTPRLPRPPPTTPLKDQTKASPRLASIGGKSGN